MKGHISKFIEDKGFGFIQDEKGQNRFFHISHLKGIGEVSVGMRVEFKPGENQKGLTANEVKESVVANQRFIKIGDRRVDLTLIKDYGKGKGERSYQKVYEREQKSGFFNEVLSLKKRVYRGRKTYISGDTKRRILEDNGEILVYLKKGDYYESYSTMNGTENKYAKKTGVHGLDVANYGSAPESDLIVEDMEYVYLTKMTGDNLTFTKDEVDLDELMERLDSYFLIQ